MKHITKIGNRFYYQRAVPQDLQKKVGKRKWSVALKTDSPRVAEIAAKKWALHFDQEIVRLRSFDESELVQAEAMLRTLGVPLPPEPLYTKEGNDAAVAAIRRLQRDTEGDFEDERDEGRTDFLKIAKRGLAEAIPDDKDRRRTARKLYDEVLTPLVEEDVKHQRAQFEQAQESVQAVAPTDTPEITKTRREALKMDLLKSWVADKKPTDQTKADTENAAQELLEFAERDDLTEIIKEDVVQWVDALRRFPNRRSQLEQDLSFRQVLDLYKEKDFTPLSSKSIQKRFNLVQAIFSNAVHSGRIDSSPFTDVKTPSFEPTVIRRPFTIPIINKIFSTEPMVTGPTDGFYWTHVLGLSSGMRLGEICMCTPDDLVSIDGAWFFDMTDFKLKTASSRRRVPIHKDVAAAGFVKWAKKQPSDSIMGFKKDVKGSPSGLASKVMNRWFNRAGIVGKEYVFHSYRHLFKDLCREADVQKDIHDRLTGHAGDNVGSGYGNFPIKVLSDSLNKVKLPVKIRKAA